MIKFQKIKKCVKKMCFWPSKKSAIYFKNQKSAFSINKKIYIFLLLFQIYTTKTYKKERERERKE